MSNAISRSDMIRALRDKGFRPDRSDRDHDYYYFYHKDKRTVARTKVSRGTGYRDYNDELFRLMLPALHLSTIRQVRDLLRCPLAQQDYIELLRGSGVLRER